MHKKLAVYANGWSKENLKHTLDGIKQYTNQHDYDLFVFVSHAAYTTYDMLNQGELSIYQLGHMEDFDGIIVFSNALNSEPTARQLCQKAAELGIPAVSIGIEIEGAAYAGIDNTRGMYQLVEHLIVQHGVKHCAYIGGTRDHVDSVARLQITKETLEKHGYTIDDEDIFYSDWGYPLVIDAINTLIASPKGLPDAIVCANDYTALAAASELAMHGVVVPDEVIVTGFDYLEMSQSCYPAITSVKQDYEQVGYNCCLLLFEQKGENAVRKMSAPSNLRIGESCGCKGDIDYEEKRHQFCRGYYVTSLRGELINQVEQSIQNSISNSVDYETLRENLQRRYESDHMFEGENFCLMLDSSYYSNLQEDDSGLHLEGFGTNMDVLVALRNGKVISQKKVDAHQLVPGYDGEGSLHTYYFLPLHIEQYSLGYFVAVDAPLLVQNNLLYSYVGLMQQELRQLRIHMRLDTMNKNLTALYNKDAMTGLYNRFGYEGMAIPMFKRSISLKENMIVFFIDINHMKLINDRFGHLQGDIAIQIVANAIKYSLRNDWIGIRYGGDEFLMIASKGDAEKAEEVKKEINHFVETEKEHRDLPYNLGVSIGYVITDYNSPKTIQDYVKDADAGMYEIKRILHEQEEKK